MKKRCLSVLLTITMLLSLMPSFGTVAFATGGTWYSSGDGSAGDPYIISDVDGLTGFANAVNGGDSFEGEYIKLSDTFDNTGKPLTTPIGMGKTPFAGTFDGNEKTVNLNISGVDFAGLFGYVKDGAIQNVSTSGSVSCSKDYVGGVVGYNAGGTVSNCSATVTVSGANKGSISSYAGGVVGTNSGTVENCSATGDVSGTNAGGVVGSNWRTVTNCCHAKGEVYGADVGGVVGYNYNNGTVTNCSATGNVYMVHGYSTSSHTGGVVGFNRGIVENCSATGAVSANGIKPQGTNYVGGVAGDNTGTVTNCYATGAVTASGNGTNHAGGVVGGNSGTVEFCYCPDTNNKIIGDGTVTDCDTFDASQKLTGSDKFLVDALNEYAAKNLSCFKWEVVGNDTPTFVLPDTSWYNATDKVFIIENVEQLEAFAFLVNTGNDFEGKTIKLSDTFDNTGKPLTTPIGTDEHPFAGTFDGNGKTVALNISGVDYGGLFGYVDGGTVQNVSTSGSVSGDAYVGGVAGCNHGGTVSNCYATVDVSGIRSAGGVVAGNDGTVSNCYAKGAVSASGNGTSYVGGVVANNHGTVTNCYATGNVSASTSSSKYSPYAGGVVGSNWGTVSNCYHATGDVSASGNETNHVGGVVGFNGHDSDISDSGIVSNCYCTNATIVNYNEDGTVNKCDTFDASQKLTNSDKSLVDALNEYVAKNPTVNNINLFQWEVIGNDTPTFFIPDTSWYNDTETVFIIENVKQLEGLASLVKDGNGFKGKTIKLSDTFDNTGKPLTTPIGTQSSFAGTFEGNGKTVELNISGVDFAGLFGYVEGGTVQNVSTSGSVSGSCVGGVVGSNAGTVTNCSATGAVSGSCVGGVVGYNDATVTNCYATGDVTGQYTSGGVVGENYSTVSNCYATGNVASTNHAGGVVGANEGTVSNCYATGTVSASSSKESYPSCAGGVVGKNEDGIVEFCYCTNATIVNYNEDGTVTDCYTFDDAQMFTNDASESIRLVDALNEYAAKNPSYFKWEVIGNNTPTFATDTSWYNDTDMVFIIENVKQLEGLAYLVNNGNSFEGKSIKLSDTFDNTEKPLTTPIGTKNNPFAGTFEGNGKTVKLNISGDAQYAGLFGYVKGGTIQNVSTSGSVSGIYVGGVVGKNDSGTVTDCYATGAVSGTYYAGGVVGYNGGTVENCYATGDVSGRYAGGVVGGNYKNGTVENCYATGTVSASGNGTNYVGGVVGYNGGTVENCYATGAVTGIDYVGGVVGKNDSGTVTDCYATGVVTSTFYAGGVVGANSGTVTDCYATGAVSASGNKVSYAGGVVGWNSATVTNCYATGDVSASGGTSVAAGGVVSLNYGTVTNCYAMGNVSASTTSSSYYPFVGGVVGANLGTVENCYATGAVTGIDSADGGVVGENYSTVSNCYCTNTNATIIGINEDGTVTNCDTFNASQKLTNGKSLVDALNEYVDANATATPSLSQWTKDANSYPYFGTPAPQTSGGSSERKYTVSTLDTEHGSLSVNGSSYAGDTVTVTVQAEAGYRLDTLTVTDAKGNEVALKTVRLGESYTFVMPNAQVTVSASFVKESTVMRFVDVKESDFFYNAVLWAVKNGITTGVDATHFAPNAITTRAQMVTFLWRASGSPEPTATTCVFTDVNAESYYAKAVMWGYENGYVKGVSATSFAPDATVTRGQTVALLARMDGVKDEDTPATHGFVDVFAADYYNNAVAWAVEQGITKGTSENTFAPHDGCTRGQIVTFLYRDFVK